LPTLDGALPPVTVEQLLWLTDRHPKEDCEVRSVAPTSTSGAVRTAAAPIPAHLSRTFGGCVRAFREPAPSRLWEPALSGR